MAFSFAIKVISVDNLKRRQKPLPSVFIVTITFPNPNIIDPIGRARGKPAVLSGPFRLCCWKPVRKGRYQNRGTIVAFLLKPMDGQTTTMWSISTAFTMAAMRAG
jgi:hypothetical protein